MIQVTPKEVRLLSAARKQLVNHWRPPDGLQINVAAGNPSQVHLLSVSLLETLTTDCSLFAALQSFRVWHAH